MTLFLSLELLAEQNSNLYISYSLRKQLVAFFLKGQSVYKKSAMYKVFYGERHLAISNNPVGNYGAIHKYSNHTELLQFVRAFERRTDGANGVVYGHDVQHIFEEICSIYRVIYAAGGVIENAKGEVLVIDRLGKLDLPKGKREQGETDEQNALREVEEETGVGGCEIIKLLCCTYHTYKIGEETVLKRTCWFQMRADGCPEPVPQSEEAITAARWLPKVEAKQMALHATKGTYESLKYVFDII